MEKWWASGGSRAAGQPCARSSASGAPGTPACSSSWCMASPRRVAGGPGWGPWFSGAWPWGAGRRGGGRWAGGGGGAGGGGEGGGGRGGGGGGGVGGGGG